MKNKWQHGMVGQNDLFMFSLYNTGMKLLVDFPHCHFTSPLHIRSCEKIDDILWRLSDTNATQ